MTNRKLPLALRHLGVLFREGAVGGMTDGHLLDQFSRGHREAAEAAFATLVERHGPMVLRVCRGVLGDLLRPLSRANEPPGRPGQEIWPGPADGSNPGADAHARFSIFAVPTAFLIGKDGKIAWRGHPLSIDVEKKIDELIAEGH